MRRAPVFAALFALALGGVTACPVAPAWALQTAAARVGVVNDVGNALAVGGEIGIAELMPNVSLEIGGLYWRRSEDFPGGQVTAQDFAVLPAVRYAFALENSKLAPYAKAGLGLHVLRSSISGVSAFGSPVFEDASATTTRLGLLVGGGVDLGVTNNLRIGGELVYHAVEGSMTQFTVHTTFLLGGVK